MQLESDIAETGRQLTMAPSALVASTGSSRQFGGGIDESRRLERLEQGVDAIAIEVERISEGQRFVTRLLSEAHDGVPIPVTQRIGEGARVGGEAGEPGRGVTT